MKVISTEQMRELDRYTIEDIGIYGEILMDRAGKGVADVVLNLADLSGIQNPNVLLFAGKGNNGGDAFVAARYLFKAGMSVEVLFAGELASVSGDALVHLSKMRTAGVQPLEVSTIEGWKGMISSSVPDIIVDGLLGTGISGPAREPVATAIRLINDLSNKGMVVSIDAPSGINTDTGEAAGDVVIADVTATMAYPKRGLLEPVALEAVGSLEVIDIGIPDALAENISSDLDFITKGEVQSLFKRRSRNSHKGSYGHVLLVGGSPGYAGAIAMSAMAALRSGVGLVTILVPESVASIVATLVPEAMVHSAEMTETESLSANAIEVWGKDIHSFDALLIGPGMSTHRDGLHLVRKVLHTSKGTVVLDADALSVCSRQLDILRTASCPTILTPHPGEMARLKNCSVAEVQADRPGIASYMANHLNTNVVLKGAGTLIAAPDQPISINMTGNPGMASGGMGDVLAGLIAGLAAQGLSPHDAAKVAVYIHGRTGDIVAQSSSQPGMIATDLIDALPEVFADISLR